MNHLFSTKDATALCGSAGDPTAAPGEYDRSKALCPVCNRMMGQIIAHELSSIEGDRNGTYN